MVIDIIWTCLTQEFVVYYLDEDWLCWMIGLTLLLLLSRCVFLIELRRFNGMEVV